jgi:Tfp pilus assembly protein PilN
MINLLPFTIKEQIKYAKYNRIALTYLRIMVLVAVILGGIFVGALYLVRKQTAAISSDVAGKQTTIAGITHTFVPTAQDVSNRLNAIKYVQSTQTHFSQVIADIAKVLPQGVTINSMTLTGNDKMPVSIGVTATSYSAALALRDDLATSPRIAGADLETISSSDGGSTYQTTVVIAFKPGEAQ